MVKNLLLNGLEKAMCKAERRPSGGDGKISCKDKYCQLFETSKRKHYFSVLNLGSKNNSLVTVNKMLMTVIRTGCKLKSDGISGEARMVFLEDRGNFYAKIFINGGLITVHPSTSEQADASVYYHTYL